MLSGCIPSQTCPATHPFSSSSLAQAHTSLTISLPDVTLCPKTVVDFPDSFYTINLFFFFPEFSEIGDQ